MVFVCGHFTRRWSGLATLTVSQLVFTQSRATKRRQQGLRRSDISLLSSLPRLHRSSRGSAEVLPSLESLAVEPMLVLRSLSAVHLLVRLRQMLHRHSEYNAALGAFVRQFLYKRLFYRFRCRRQNMYAQFNSF